jgi:radical SAM protein with 4Fe4S-binding SPASM domain
LNIIPLRRSPWQRAGPDRPMNDAAVNKRKAWEEFLAGRLRLDSRPFRAAIEVTQNCNFKCIMCQHSWHPRYREHRPEYDMKPALFRKIVQEAFPYLEEVLLQGYGETIHSPHWLEFLDLCEPFAGRIRFVLVTNLSRKNAEMWRKIVRMDFQVIISCDGATETTFEAIRRNGRFEGILENLAVLKAARQEHKTGALQLQVTLQRLNYREMPLFIDLAQKYGVEQVSFVSVRKSIHPASPARLRWPALRSLLSGLAGAAHAAHGRFNDSDACEALPRPELAEMKTETLRRAEAAGIQVLFNDAYLAGLEPSQPVDRLLAQDSMGRWLPGKTSWNGVSSQQKCFKPFSFVFINYRGDVGPCNHLISDESWRCMGNIARQPFPEIWNSPAYQRMRRRLLDARPDNASCRWCFLHRMTD